MPKVSIILPTFNVEKYIKKALDSCINQSLKDIEIIVVDDLGSDNSIKIAKEEALKDKRIKIIHNEKNLGLLAARYQGALNANSPYITFLDPDDTLALNACELALKEIKEANLLRFGFAKIDEMGGGIEENLPNYKDYEELKNIIKQSSYKYLWNIWSILFKKDFYLDTIRHLSSYKINMAEDLLAFAFLINPSIKTANFIGYFYNFNESSLSNPHKKTKEHLQRNLQDFKTVSKIIKNSNLEKFIIKEFDFYLEKEIFKLSYDLNELSYLRYKFLKKKIKLYNFLRKLKCKLR
ncbi:glycosyltransferase family 2 protein [Campylobacter novaezeelandiae]|uniref:glycosyltransferase family 2 protein n=1 Tax=Campylobacter novaezeelandiae TaxID=2267891 RepID=UPI001037DB4A|nr:glycosyltransferase family 2 protein [Campylobacter novaezeelandiae]QWU79508.1 glycosyltransferase, family 2 [Campylobacter novaezeelandiae]TBR80193.1 glycosyltransferase family 2 protein [Campylobacter novaezeelandiae]